MKKNIARSFLALVAVFGLFAGSVVPTAYAQSASELQAQIASLQAQLALLMGQGSVSTTFTSDLTIGSTGSQVTALQTFLIGRGFTIPAGATGYFGEQTRSAVAAFQSANGIAPAAGYFGPITRAKVNGTVVVNPPSNDNDDLEGGAGSVDTYELMASLNNEEVGEDEEDVEVAGLEIEADDGSDLRLTAVRLVFDEGSADEDFEDYADEVSIWLDGDEVGRIDADEFNDNNDWTKTVSLEDAVIDRGETAELVVAVSGISNLDSDDEGETWTVDFRQVRFQDADGATISEDPSTNARTFSFEAFASAANVELRIREDDQDVNDARTIQVDQSDDTDDVEVLSFTLEAEGDSDIELQTLGVNVDVTGAANTDDVISSLILYIDGEEVARSENVTGGGSDETYVFEDVDTVIDAGETVDAMITADFFSTDDALDEGDTISFAITETETDNGNVFDAEDESGEELVDGDITGSATSGAFDLRSSGIMVTFVSASETVSTNDGADNDTGTFTIRFNVEAVGDTVYVSKSAVATTESDITAETTTGGALYRVLDGDTAVTDDLSDAVTFTSSGGASQTNDNIVLQEGEDTDITLTIVRANNGDASDDGLFRATLEAIGWATTDSTTWNVYDFDLEDFKTDPLFLN